MPLPGDICKCASHDDFHNDTKRSSVRLQYWRTPASV